MVSIEWIVGTAIALITAITGIGYFIFRRNLATAQELQIVIKETSDLKDNYKDDYHDLHKKYDGIKKENKELRQEFKDFKNEVRDFIESHRKYQKLLIWVQEVLHIENIELPPLDDEFVEDLKYLNNNKNGDDKR